MWIQGFPGKGYSCRYILCPIIYSDQVNGMLFVLDELGAPWDTDFNEDPKTVGQLNCKVETDLEIY